MTMDTSAMQCRTELGSEFSVMIARYPFLSPHEVERLVAIYPRLRVVDLALMMSDYDLAPMLDDFCRENRIRLQRTPDLRVAVAVGAAMVVAVLIGLVI